MKLEQVVPWGRSLAEYRAMFSLPEADLQRRIVGCGDGPASFNAEMTAAGRPTVTSVDPLYAFEAADITRRITEAERLVMAEVRTNVARFKWSWFEDPEALLRARKQAMAVFLEDYERGKRQKRCVAGALPRLAFAADAFDLCVCSHLLFLYSDHLSLDLHRRGIAEPLRLAPEVRIYPLQDLSDALSPHLEPVCRELHAKGFSTELVPVGYEFFPGANQMLRVRRQG
jgi:hypothetical protein